MEKKIIAGFAALLLSAGVAAAQSNSSSAQSSSSAGTSASAGMQASGAADTGTATSKKKTHVASRYPKAEARLNADEAQTTKELNTEESQAVASNSGGNGSMSANGNAGMRGSMASPSSSSGSSGNMSGSMNAGTPPSSGAGNGSSQPQ